MNTEAVNRRLDLVGTSGGSIVSVATWCALHAQDADVVVPCLTARLVAPSTTDEVRASLLYVLHELLLTCASRGTSDGAKRAVLTAVARALPAALDKVWQTSPAAGRGNGAFNAAVGKLVVWWSMLNLFPRQWLDEIRRKHRKAQEDSGLEPSVAVTLQRAVQLLSHYQDAKEQWVRGKERHQAQREQPADGSAEEAARRALVLLRKAVDGQLEGSRSLSSWCAAQQAELDGQQYAPADSSAKREKLEPTLSAVKTEEASTANPMAEEDDILGSFY